MKYNSLTRVTHERTVITYPFVWWDEAFTSEECDQIVEYCDSIGTEQAKVVGGPTTEYTDDKIRICGVKFHNPNEQTKHIFEKIDNVIYSINNHFYGFDLNGYDSFQYTSYDSSRLGHYDWHMDLIMGKDAPSNMIEPRKLSLSLVLNDDYEGGDFCFNSGGNLKAEQKKGRVIAFPSFMMHKVEPVTKGFRKSIVIWVTGPKFV
jgi:PKHD-type hydroxylase